LIDQVISLPDGVLLANHAHKRFRGIINMQVLVQGIAIAAHQDRFTLFNPVDPGEIPANLPDHTLHWAIGGGRFYNHNREFLTIIGF
jgi:hypothetical protein